MNERVLQQKKNGHDAQDDENKHKFLTFLLGEKIYAFSILKVREIIEYGEVTPMPMMPDFICGAINLRGQAVPVIDLAQRLGHEKSDIGRRTCIIITELTFADQTLLFGVIVDAVSRVIDFLPSEIEPAPVLGGNVRTDFIEGMGKVDEHFVIMLDIGRVLSMEDLRVLAGASATD